MTSPHVPTRMAADQHGCERHHCPSPAYSLQSERGGRGTVTGIAIFEVVKTCRTHVLSIRLRSHWIRHSVGITEFRIAARYWRRGGMGWRTLLDSWKLHSTEIRTGAKGLASLPLGSQFDSLLGHRLDSRGQAEPSRVCLELTEQPFLSFATAFCFHWHGKHVGSTLSETHFPSSLNNVARLWASTDWENPGAALDCLWRHKKLITVTLDVTKGFVAVSRTSSFSYFSSC